VTLNEESKCWPVLTDELVIIWILIFLGLPETLKFRKAIVEESAVETSEGAQRPPLSRTSTRELVQKRSKKYFKVARMLFIDPLSVILYLRFPPVALTVYYSAVTFGSLYVLNISLQYTFEKPPYDFATIIIGLLYIPNSIGYILASLIGGRWMDWIMKREAIKANRVDDKGKLIFRPEDRMRENAWVGALMYPCALIWYGWTAEKGVLWIAPASRIALSVFAKANMVVRIDDCQFFLRRGLHAHLRHVNYHVDRIYAPSIKFRRSVEQSLQKYLVMYRCSCGSANYFSDRQWLAFHYPGTMDSELRCCHLGYEKVWAWLAFEDGSRVGVEGLVKT
jgi:hypothetical protein